MICVFRLPPAPLSACVRGMMTVGSDDDHLNAGRTWRLALLRCHTSTGLARGGLVLVTQCSFDRLHALERILAAWDGAVSCAMLLEQRDTANGQSNEAASVKRMEAAVRAVHARYSDRLVVDILCRSQRDASKPYPINLLRNASLQNSSLIRNTSLVWIVDVDCVPSAGALAALVGSPERAAALHRLCCDEGDVLVVPCIERAAPSLSEAHGVTDVRQPPTIAEAKAALQQGVAWPFMHARWPQGHRATGFEAWASAGNELFLGPLAFEECFEPYVVVSRALCPRFDETLTGCARPIC